jgi:hypothetical protein
MFRYFSRVFAAGLLLLAGSFLASPLRAATFSEVARQAGVLNGYNGYLGGGVAVEDFDNDGDQDLAIAGGPEQPNRLFENVGDPGGLGFPSFVEISTGAGITDIGHSKGVAFADVDNDGLPDLVFGTFDGSPDYLPDPGFESSLTLYMNNGDKTFTDVTTDAGLQLNTVKGFGVALADVDHDGWLDLFLANRGTVAPGGQDYLFHNRGDGTFEDVSASSGIASAPLRRSIQPGFFDYDNDGDQDLYMANDKYSGNLLFRNEFKESGMLTFTDVSAGSGADQDMDGMSTATGDYDNDGDLDLYVTNTTEGNALFRNNGDGTFTNRTLFAGTGGFRVCWGASWLDLNNDMNLDLYVVAQGVTSDNLLFRNLADGTFREEAKTSGCEDPSESFGLAVADLNRDGDLDLVVENGHDLQANPDRLTIFMNNGEGRKSISFKLVGLQSNWDGVGARLTLTVGSTVQIREIRAGSSYLSQEPKEATFGVANVPAADQLVVKWPSGRTDTFDKAGTPPFTVVLEAGNRYRLIEGVGVQTGTYLLSHNAQIGETVHVLDWDVVPWPEEDAFPVQRVRLENDLVVESAAVASLPRAGRAYHLDLPAPKNLETGTYRYDVKVSGPGGTRSLWSSPTFTVDTPPVTALFAGQNFPNPFTASTRIPVSVPEGVSASIHVFDLSGRLLTRVPVPAGSSDAFTMDRNRILGSRSRVPAGVYYYQLFAGDTPTSTRFKMVLLP